MVFLKFIFDLGASRRVTESSKGWSAGRSGDIGEQGEIQMVRTDAVGSVEAPKVQGENAVVVQRLIPLGPKPSKGLAASLDATITEVVELGRRCLWTPGAGGLVFPPRRDSLLRSQTEPDGVKVLYALYQGHIVGFLVLHIGDSINSDYAKNTVECMQRMGSRTPAFVRSLGVAPEVRGKGVGQSLLEKAKKYAARAGALLLAGHVKCQPDSDRRLTTAFTRAEFVESPGRVAVHVTQNKCDGTFHEFEGPYGGEQVPHVISFEYVVWVAPTRGALLVGEGSAMRVHRVPRQDDVDAGSRTAAVDSCQVASA
jgi:GNAT superfamily N-acetyltransferase